MRDHVTVIPSDSLIIVNRQPLRFAFTAPDTLHALQWREGKGHIEFTGETQNNPLKGEEEYQREVAPFVALWEAEKARMDEEAAQVAYEAANPPAEVVGAAIRAERDARIAATDYLMLPDYPLAAGAREAWAIYRTALRDITEQDGFPWTGPDSAPWPARPEGTAAQCA